MATWGSLSTEVRAKIFKYAIPQARVDVATLDLWFKSSEVHVANPTLPYILIDKRSRTEVSNLLSKPLLIATIADRFIQWHNHELKLQNLVFLFGRVEIEVTQNYCEAAHEADIDGVFRRNKDQHITAVENMFEHVQVLQAEVFDVIKGYSVWEWKTKFAFDVSNDIKRTKLREWDGDWTVQRKLGLLNCGSGKSLCQKNQDLLYEYLQYVASTEAMKGLN